MGVEMLLRQEDSNGYVLVLGEILPELKYLWVKHLPANLEAASY